VRAIGATWASAGRSPEELTDRLRRMNAVRDSEQAQELIDGHSGVANKARRIPTESSLCWGVERFTRISGLTITRWLPT